MRMLNSANQVKFLLLFLVRNLGYVGVGGPASGAPKSLVGSNPHSQLELCAGESAAYAHRRMQPVTHLYAKCSQQLDSWAVS